MKIIGNGGIYRIFKDGTVVGDALPAGTYKVHFSELSGFSLEEVGDLTISERVYGSSGDKIDMVFDSFKKFNRNLGIILSGKKGIGKSLFTRGVSEVGRKMGIPTILVDRSYNGISAFISSIEQECIVIFDEFDKTFSEKEGCEAQSAMLSLFDGIDCGKRIFIVTCNEIYRLNDYLINRPGRFHYHFRFKNPNSEEIREYLMDNIPEEMYPEISDVMVFADRVELNYDCLRSIAFELSMGRKFKDFISDLNILNINTCSFTATIYFEGGGVLKNSDVDIDIYNSDPDSERESIYVYGRNGGFIGKIFFYEKDIKWSQKDGGDVVYGKDVIFEANKSVKSIKPSNDDDDSVLSELDIERIREIEEYTSKKILKVTFKRNANDCTYSYM